MAIYTEPAEAALLRQAARLSQKVVVVERTARSSLLGPAAAAADVPFTVRVTLLRGEADPVSGTLGELVNAYTALPEGRLVITGAAGAGKTVLALELVLLLLQRRRPEQPVPVRLSLAEWDPDIPLERWLVRQVSETYSLRLRTAEALVAQRLVLPVLDGLDEMDGEAGSSMRAARALEQINHYHGPRGVTPLVVTCRATTYERVSREHGGLAAAAVARVEELDIEQIRNYLEQALAARSEGEKRAWTEVIDNLHRLPADALATPWRLYLATTVYSGGRDPRDLLALSAPGEVDRVLLERLIPVAVESYPNRRYDTERTKKWLTSFATRSTHPGKSDQSSPVADIALHRLEFIVGRNRVLALHGFIFALACIGLLLLTRARWGQVPDEDIMAASDAILLIGTLFGALAMGNSVEPIRLIRPRRRKRDEGEPFWDVMRRNDRENLKFQLKGAVGRRILTYVGLASLFPLTVVLLSIKWLFPYYSWPQAVLADLVVHGLLLAGVVLLFAALLAFEATPVLVTVADTEPVLRPGAPLRQDAVVSALIVGSLGVCALFWLKVAWTLGLLILPYVVGRAWMRYAVSIAVGANRGMAPLRLTQFLAWAHRAGLLRTTGRTYQFRHRALQQWLLNEDRESGEIQHLDDRVRDRSLGGGERLAAAGALVDLGTPEGTMALYHLATDGKAQLDTRVQAMEALAGEEELRDVAVRMLTAFCELSSVNRTLEEFITATQALARLEPRTAFDLVGQVAQNRKARPDIREFAASILQRSAKSSSPPKTPQPSAPGPDPTWNSHLISDQLRKTWGQSETRRRLPSETTGPGGTADLAWVRGLDAYMAGAYADATDNFREAVRLDPGMADAWLGLHVLRTGAGPDDEPTQALLAMVRHQDRFGEQRRLHDRPLNSWYWLGWWGQSALETPADLQLAHASQWLDKQHLTELNEALNACPSPEDNPQAQFLHACRCYLVKDWERLVRLTESLLDDAHLGIEARLFGGMARVHLGLGSQAEKLLETALVRCRSETPQRMELRYWLARAYEASGRTAAALPLYRAVHEKDAEFTDTADRLAALQAESSVETIAGPDGADADETPSGETAGPASEPGNGRSYAGLTADQLVDHVVQCRRAGRPEDPYLRGVLAELRRGYGHDAYPFAASLERIAFGTHGPALFQEGMQSDEVEIVSTALEQLTGSTGEESLPE
ncbi:NACHT domain-containing protein [Streptomyces scopuliridis]|uniref:NACHT domain-containing protein n=1 Tax=Streptomyces scopuliridis TaxID=452529 RepID=UPI0036933C10